MHFGLISFHFFSGAGQLTCKVYVNSTTTMIWTVCPTATWKKSHGSPGFEAYEGHVSLVDLLLVPVTQWRRGVLTKETKTGRGRMDHFQTKNK